MKLNHAGLNIQSEDEIVNFYENILGFNLEYQFDTPPELSDNIFGINKQLKVFLYKKEALLFELFVHFENFKQGFSHLCLEVKDREQMITKCEKCDYKVKRIERNNRPDLLFIEDKAGNIFELKIEEK